LTFEGGITVFPRLLTLLLLWLSNVAVGRHNILAADLKPETLEGFSRYVERTEARIARQMSQPDRILYIDSLTATAHEEALTALKSGQVFMQRLELRDDSGGVMKAPGGLIHHWVGDVFIPGVSVNQVLGMVQDYDHHQEVYRPDVVRSKLVAKNGNDYKVELRFRKKKVVTVTLNTEHDVRYTELDPTHWYSRSVSTRVAEVENAGKPDEHEKPVGHDGGFLWRINSYWRFVGRDGGVYVECESVSLTRDIPPGLSWLIKGLVTGVSKDSLQHTLKSTRAGVLARSNGASVLRPDRTFQPL
jgi:hypothetical protein